MQQVWRTTGWTWIQVSFHETLNTEIGDIYRDNSMYPNIGRLDPYWCDGIVYREEIRAIYRCCCIDVRLKYFFIVDGVM